MKNLNGSLNNESSLEFALDYAKKNCREKGYNMSAKIEQAMQEIMKE